MKRTLGGLVALVTVAGGVWGASVASADTTPATTGHDQAPAATDPTALPAAMVSALRRDLDLDDAGLRARLATEAAAPAVERRLRGELDDHFGGAWVAADGTLTVGVTDAGDAARVRAAGATPAVVDRSASQLGQAKSALDKHAKTAGAAVQSWYVDPATNSVVVEASGRSAAEKFIAASGATGTRVVLRPAKAAYQPVYDVRGGDEYVINSSVLCSVGLPVSGGFVTAGHCGTAGATTAGSGVAQGTFKGSSFPGNDYAWVQVNSVWRSGPWVNNYSGGTVNVTGSAEAAVGSSVCRSGRTTGWRCGVITGRDVTVNYSGSYVYGLAASSACAQPGDSGGAFISGTQAQGVTSGAGGDCSSGGTTVFQPVNEILSAYGLALVTTSNTSRIIGLANKCIDVPNGAATDGNPLQIWNCNNSTAQDWTFPGDGTVRARGMCMDVAWGSTANGAVIQLVNCNGNAAQQFVLSGAGDLVNPQANKCVDVKDNNSADGAKLQLWECAGTANQKWHRG